MPRFDRMLDCGQGEREEVNQKASIAYQSAPAALAFKNGNRQSPLEFDIPFIDFCFETSDQPSATLLDRRKGTDSGAKTEALNDASQASYEQKRCDSADCSRNFPLASACESTSLTSSSSGDASFPMAEESEGGVMEIKDSNSGDAQEKLPQENYLPSTVNRRYSQPAASSQRGRLTSSLRRDLRKQNVLPELLYRDISLLHARWQTSTA